MSERAINVIRGLSLCEAFSLPPRAIIKTEANRQSAGADAVFCAPSSLTKASFRRSAVSQKIVQPKVARFASFSDSVGKINCENLPHSLFA